MNLDALRSWTKCILIEIREHNEEFHQLPGVDTRQKNSSEAGMNANDSIIVWGR